MSFPRLIIQPVPCAPDEGGRCFCCRDRIMPGVAQHRAFDAEGDERGLVCPLCAAASDDELRERMRDLAGRLFDWAGDLILMTKHPIRRIGSEPPTERVH